jgi:hypothetical protein
MKRALLLSLVLGARAASADPHHVLVLKPDGNASSDAKAKVDAQINKLAKSLGGNVEAGEISFNDATAMVGCNPAESSCKDQVIDTLGVDEIVVTTVSTTGGETKVTVRRVAKVGMPKEQTTTVASGQAPDAKITSDIGPLFGVTAAPPPPTVEKPAVATTPPPPAPAEQPTPAATTPPPTTTPPAPVQTAQVEPTVTAAPNNQVAPPEDRPDHRRLEVTGMGIGGGLVVLSFIMWAEAASTQSDIDAAPTKTHDDFVHLQDLESSADSYAALGNVMFIGGVALGAVSTYFFWRDRKAASTQQARIAPTVFDHGAGITLSFGGAR